jgi:hypothetical protein
MSFRSIYIAIVCACAWSCSSDNEDGTAASNNIVGTWDATELIVDQNTASDEAIFGSQILQVLTNENCFIITLKFNQDLTAEARSAVNNLEINVSGTGLSVPCPTDFESEANTYTYADGVVSFINEDGEMVNARVSIDGDVMTVNAASLEIPNFNDSGELIFQRR